MKKVNKREIDTVLGPDIFSRKFYFLSLKNAVDELINGSIVLIE